MSTFYVPANKNFFEIKDVEYNGKIHNYKLFSDLTNPLNQDELIEYDIKEKQQGNPHLMDSILHLFDF